jgi:RNA polymerase sigma factor (sigma-70 family)
LLADETLYSYVKRHADTGEASMSEENRGAAGTWERGIVEAAIAHRAVMERTAQRILGCREAARDAVQEALVTLWLDPPAHTEQRAWLVRTVIHRSLHERRTCERRRRWEGEAVRAAADDCPICEPERELERREVAAALDTALRSLGEPFRSVFVLREVDGWDYERIARRLGIPVGTVRSRLNRARAALRRRIELALDTGRVAASRDVA